MVAAAVEADTADGAMADVAAVVATEVCSLATHLSTLDRYTYTMIQAVAQVVRTRCLLATDAGNLPSLNVFTPHIQKAEIVGV